ncbi:MAG TPA: CAP domain-containing protein [Polyangiaceae bacterium]|nr:CAP domain-containing protein [Polyangiaceae bacterium]
MRILRVCCFAITLACSGLAGCSSDDDGGGSGGNAGGGNGGDTEPAAMSGMTAAHNAARAGVNPAAAAAIPPLAWSGALAQVAQGVADKCVWAHSNNQYGENLYASTNASTPGQVVSSWVSEVADYDYASNSCSKVCGHYTQVVWAKSARLGCAKKTCTQNSPFGGGSWELWVCSYDPPGNFNNQNPY